MSKLRKTTKTCEGCWWLVEITYYNPNLSGGVYYHKNNHDTGNCIARPPSSYLVSGEMGLEHSSSYPEGHINGIACGLYIKEDPDV